MQKFMKNADKVKSGKKSHGIYPNQAVYHEGMSLLLKFKNDQL